MQETVPTQCTAASAIVVEQEFPFWGARWARCRADVSYIAIAWRLRTRSRHPPSVTGILTSQRALGGEGNRLGRQSLSHNWRISAVPWEGGLGSLSRASHTQPERSGFHIRGAFDSVQ